MSAISIRELLEAGVHFGHQTSRWDPAMRPFIFGARNGIHIIDLQKTEPMFQKAYDFVVAAVSRGETVLFVATKKQAQEVVRTHAQRCGMYHVTQRWLGGFLTNFRTIKGSIERLRTIDKMLTDGTSDKLTKKETLNLFREREKLEANLGGIKNMERHPGVVFIVDIMKEHLAVDEARRLGIKTVAVVDTNTNPQFIDFPIPGNDDAIRSIELFASRIADAVLEGRRAHNSQFGGRMGDHDDGRIEFGQIPGGPEVMVKHAGMEMPVPEASASPSDDFDGEDER